MKLATHQRDLINLCRDKPNSKELIIDLVICFFAWIWLFIVFYPAVNSVCIMFMAAYTVIQIIKLIYFLQLKKSYTKWKKHVLSNYEFKTRKYAHAELFNLGINTKVPNAKIKLTIKALTHVGVIVSIFIAKMPLWFFVYVAILIANSVLTIYHTLLLRNFVKEITPAVIKIDQDKMSPYFYAKELFPTNYAWRPVLTKGEKDEPIEYATAKTSKNKKRKRHVKHNSF